MIYRKRKKVTKSPYSKWLARKKKWENREARKMEKELSRIITFNSLWDSKDREVE